VNRVYGTVDRVHGRGVPRSTGFMKPWPSALGSTARTKSIEGVSACLIVAMGSGPDNGETPIWGERWRQRTLMSPRFSAYKALNRGLILPTTPHWQEELGSLPLGGSDRWGLWVATASLLRPWPASRSSCGQPLTARTGWEACRHPPLAPLPVRWLQSATNSSNLVAVRVRWVSSFTGTNVS
jgi:hypothetical protein